MTEGSYKEGSNGGILCFVLRHLQKTSYSQLKYFSKSESEISCAIARLAILRKNCELNYVYWLALKRKCYPIKTLNCSDTHCVKWHKLNLNN